MHFKKYTVLFKNILFHVLQQRDKDTFISFLSGGFASGMLAFSRVSFTGFLFSELCCSVTLTHLRGQLLSVNLHIALSWATAAQVREETLRVPQKAATWAPLPRSQPQPPDRTTVYISCRRVLLELVFELHEAPPSLPRAEVPSVSLTAL